MADAARCSISVHAMDLVGGRPLEGARVALVDGAGAKVGEATVDGSGRVDHLAPDAIDPGVYELRVDRPPADGADEDWEILGVALTIELRRPGHYHVPVLLGTPALVVYRGSR